MTTNKLRAKDWGVPLKVLEFPDRQNERPAWRQEVTDRLRAYQEERGRLPGADSQDSPAAETAGQAGKNSSGVVSFSNRKELDERVVRALQRLETARKNAPDFGFTNEPEDTAPPEPETVLPAVLPEPVVVTAAAKASPTSGLSHGLRLPVTIMEQPPVSVPENAAPPTRPALTMVATPAPAVSEANPVIAREVEEDTDEVLTAPAAPRPRLVCVNIVDDDYLERQDSLSQQDMSRGLRKLLPVVGKEGDLAPLTLRAVAATVDWGLSFVASWPILILAVSRTSNWSWKQLGILLAVHMMLFMALYATLITRYAGRTWGQELLFLHVAHVEDGSLPTLRQCALRSLAYVLSPLTLGIGLFYALRNTEGRAWHDIASGTIVLRS